MTNEQFYAGVLHKYEMRRQQRARRKKAIAVWGVGGIVVVAAAVCVLLFENGNGGTPPVSLPTTTVAPTTTTTQPIGIGGDNPYPKKPFEERFWPESAFDVSEAMGYDAYMKWTEEFYYMGGDRPVEEWNVYNLIHENNIPRETVERLCAEVRAFREPDDAAVMSEADIELLYTGTRAEVYRHFTAIYAVTVGETPYSAFWLATHTAEDYLAAGMTVEQVTRAHAGMCVLEPDVLLRHEIEYVEQQLYEMMDRVQ